jgi:hypothetical protein
MASERSHSSALDLDPSLGHILYDENHYRSIRMSDGQVDFAAEKLLGSRKFEMYHLWWSYVWIVLFFVLAVFVYRLLYMIYLTYWSSPVGVLTERYVKI